MELEKFSRQLKILEMLVGNTSLTMADIADRLDISTRSVYRYIEFYRNLGFDIYNDHGIYCIDHSSPFIEAITQKRMLNPEELQVVATLLSRQDKNDPVVNRIRNKLRSTYGIEFQSDAFTYDRRMDENTETLKDAIRKRRQCILQRYHSLSSPAARDRLVEPYKYFPLRNEVRCYEIESGECKTFKIARIRGKVMIKDKKWEHGDRHRAYITDLFGFSAEKSTRVVLRLTNVSKTILVEEFGYDESKILIEDGEHYLVSLAICNNHGIGRFIMGMLNEVEIVKGTSLKDYIDTEIQKYRDKMYMH